MKRRIFSLLIAIALVLAILPQMPVIVFAVDNGAGERVLEGGNRDFAWPVPSVNKISSCFIDYPIGHSHKHYALDINTYRGADIVASYDGVVYKVLNNNSSGNGGYGNSVILKHSYRLRTGDVITLYTKYNHMNSIDVREGQTVYKGTTRLGGVGGSGATADTYPNHLDFQILYTASGNLTASDYGNRSTCSIDPFVNDLLEKPDGFNASGASSWCTCCYEYVKYVNALYSIPLCDHPSYDSLGICTSCGAEFDWEHTFNTGTNGTYKVTSTFTPRTDKPYDAATKADYTIASGERVEVLAHYKNAFDNTWYKFLYNGKVGYVYESYLQYQGIAPLRVTCSDFSPADQAVLERKAQPVIGTVNSNYPLSAIYAYLDGNHYATWQAGNNSTTEVSLRPTDINYALPFGSLSDGKHTIELIAHSFAHNDGVKFHSSVFYINAKTEEDTRPGKPTLNVSLDEDYVTFTWGATNNTTHYNLWLAKKNGDAEWEEIEQIFYAENGLSRTLEPGEYRAQLLSYNSNAWESDNSDWQHTWADDVFFTIEANTYTVTFDANGGTGAPASQTAQCGTMMALPTTIPARFGLNFLGWALTEDATTPYCQPGHYFQADSDTTLYAVWKAETLKGGVGFGCAPQIVHPGTGFYYHFVPEEKGYWRIYSTGTDDYRVYVYDAYRNLIASDDDSGGNRQFLLDYNYTDSVYIIYVQFYISSVTGEIPFNVVKGYNISFNANGGEGAPNSCIQYTNIDTTLSTNVPTRSGYTFLGWATSSTAINATYQPGDSFMPNADVMLYAVWKVDCESAGHNYTPTVTQKGTCVSPQIITYTCENCGQQYTETIANLGHDYKATITAPTCTAQGYTTYTCHRCGDSYKGNFTAANGHGFGQVTIYAPAPGVQGYSEHTCTSCGLTEKFDYVDFQGISVSGTVTSYLTDGTVTIRLMQSGKAVYTTTVSGKNAAYTFDVVEPGTYTLEIRKADHITRSFRIEVTDTNVVQDAKICPIGDVTGDGNVNIKDFQRLLRHVNKTNPLTDYELACGDVTGDGNCNIKDFQRLLRHVNKTNPLF